jgi:hypothetical protein
MAQASQMAYAHPRQSTLLRRDALVYTGTSERTERRATHLVRLSGRSPSTA